MRGYFSNKHYASAGLSIDLSFYIEPEINLREITITKSRDPFDRHVKELKTHQAGPTVSIPSVQFYSRRKMWN
jgi:hypothetical protein